MIDYICCSFLNCLGWPVSPKSHAKHHREHYVVKDSDDGKCFRCLNCGDIGGFEAFGCFPCNASDAEQAKSADADDAASQAASLRLAQALQAEEDELIDQDLEAELLAEQLSLEELVLQAEEGELQRLLAQEEAELLQAKMESLETRMEYVGELLPPPGSGGSSSSRELKKLPAIITKRSLEHELELSEGPKAAEAKRPRMTHEAEHKQSQRAAYVSGFMCVQDGIIYCLHSNYGSYPPKQALLITAIAEPRLG